MNLSLLGTAIADTMKALVSNRHPLPRYATLPGLTKILRPLPVQSDGKGLEAIMTGLEGLRLGNVPGRKLVVTS